jgi:hypothetical protein
MRAKRKKTPSEPAEGQFDGGKIEGRLTAEEAEAFAAYMRDRFLTNKSDVLRSALAQFLVREGYLENPAKPEKRGGDEKFAKKSIVRGWQKVTRRLALVMTAAIAWLSTASALSNPHLETTAWRIAVANGAVRHEHDTIASAIGGRVAECAREAADWFVDLEPAYQAAITVTTSIILDLPDGKLQLLGGLQLW